MKYSESRGYIQVFKCLDRVNDVALYEAENITI